MKGLLIDDKVIIESKASISKLEQRGYGKKADDRLELSLIEALFLAERGSLEIKNASFEEILEKAKEEEEFIIKYKVYKDLRSRGYVVKTGFKFGAHFRVYERGTFGKEHSLYLVHVVKEKDILSFTELSRAVRLAHSVRKSMVFAVVDEEGEVTYYKVARMVP